MRADRLGTQVREVRTLPELEMAVSGEVKVQILDTKVALTLDQRINHIASATATLARLLDLHDTAQALIEDIHGPMCGLCGERCKRSHRTDRNVHRSCWEEEKA